MEKNKKGEKKSPLHKKNSFKIYKKNTLASLNEIEYFLNNFQKFYRYIKLYKLLK